MFLSNPKKITATGFTIIELLVVMTLMMVVISASVGIFLLTSRTQKKIISNQQLQSDMRYAFETMARDIHISSIDYDYYSDNLLELSIGGFVQPMDILALRDVANQQVLYRISPDTKALELSRDGVDWHKLLADNVELKKVRFYIVPASNPFEPCSGAACDNVPNEQPRVTIVLTAKNYTENLGANYPISSMWLQTTILTRSYYR